MNVNIKDYTAGISSKQYGYKSFIPNLINKEWTIGSPEISTLLEEANLRLGELNAFSTTPIFGWEWKNGKAAYHLIPDQSKSIE